MGTEIKAGSENDGTCSLERMVSQLRAELEQVKAERDNWWQQYNAMKCAGDSDLERENENLRSALRLRRDWLTAEAARADERSKSYDASCGLPSAAMLRNQAQLIDGALAQAQPPTATIERKGDNQ